MLQIRENTQQIEIEGYIWPVTAVFEKKNLIVNSVGWPLFISQVIFSIIEGIVL